MDHQPAGFQIQFEDDGNAILHIAGDWLEGNLPADLSRIDAELASSGSAALTVTGAALGHWDSAFTAFLYSCHTRCRAGAIDFRTESMPEGVEKLLALATAVAPHRRPAAPPASLLEVLNPMDSLCALGGAIREFMEFIGEVAVASGRLLRGKANTRFVDFRGFCYQAGPDAFAIISLTSVLVGMILAYLGAVQLRQFGAEIYVADLVVIGSLREMGALMTAIVMAGRTGAAYAAQLGTMQTNEEIDAIATMGISPMEFLVLPRMLALIVIMPLLTIYADLLSIFGGGIVALGMGISPIQYMNQSELAMSFTHISVGLIKSVMFAVLIAVAGCRAGIKSGRSSAAVGEAATRAVVTAIVYLIVADATINIIFQQLEM